MGDIRTVGLARATVLSLFDRPEEGWNYIVCCSNGTLVGDQSLDITATINDLVATAFDTAKDIAFIFDSNGTWLRTIDSIGRTIETYFNEDSTYGEALKLIYDQKDAEFFVSFHMQEISDYYLMIENGSLIGYGFEEV
jgi:protease II